MFEARADWVERQARLAALATMRNSLRTEKWIEDRVPQAPLWGAAGASGPLAETLWSSLCRVRALAREAVLDREVARSYGLDLLWLLECAAEAVPSCWWEEQVARWRSSLAPEIRSWFECDDATFEELLAARVSAASAPVENEVGESGLEKELFGAFLEEVRERSQNCEALLLDYEKNPIDADVLHALFRHFHSLKGAASAVGLDQAAQQLHQGESILQAVREGEIELDASSLVDFLLALGDSVRALAEQACGLVPSKQPMDDVEGALARLLQGASADASSGSPAPTAASAAPSRGSGQEDLAALLAVLQKKGASGQLDAEVLALIHSLQEKAEQFSQRAAQLEREVLELRTVALEELFRRLPRVLRDACRQEGKQATLCIAESTLRIPREAVEPLSGVLTHLVRNAVAHGIEAPEKRLRLGKPAVGQVKVQARQEGGRLKILVEDDGAGLDFEAIRQRAVALGLLSADATVGEEQLIDCVFRPGFSTRVQVNGVAGRGVGMDAVLADVRSLGGDVSLVSWPGKGTRVEILLPEEPRLRGGA